MPQNDLKNLSLIERFSVQATKWVGSTQSLIVHTVLFVASFVLAMWGIPLDKILLVLTTIVSLEAIYLSIFIQMSVNRQARRLHAVSRDIEEIQEDVEDIQEDVEEIQEDVEEIQEDVEDIGEDVGEMSEEEPHKEPVHDRYANIEHSLATLIAEVQKLKNNGGK